MPSDTFEMAMRGDYQQCYLSARSAEGGFLVVAVIMGVAYY